MTLLQKTMLKEILVDPKSKNLKPIEVAELLVKDYEDGFEMGIYGSKVNKLLADKDFEEIYKDSFQDFTGHFDNNGYLIFIGDKLRSEWNYEIIVAKDGDGDYIGKLVCEDTHSCKNIPYSLNKGKGYIKIN